MDDCDAECGAEIRRHFANDGIDAHVTTVPPIVASDYEPLGLRCPHGVAWHAEPTGEQLAKWKASND